MVEIEQNYKIVLSEVPHYPGLSDEKAARIGATDVRKTYIYVSIEYTDFSFSIHATLSECILKGGCSKVLASDMLDEVEHDEMFDLDENYKPKGFGPGNITSRLIVFIDNNSIEHNWLREIRKFL